ncbi:MAG: 50S ribosomal protein L32 [Candidatus Omnitrophota bacterium]
MALPKRRHSRQRQAKRRTHDRLVGVRLTPCPQCGAPKRPHRLCRACGYYAGREVIHLKEKKASKEKRG